MKFLIPLFLLLYPMVFHAQHIDILSERMSEGIRDGIKLTVKDIDEKFMDITWKNYIRKYGGKYRWNRKEKEHKNEGVSIPNISNQPLNVYAVTRSKGKDAEIVIWLEEGTRFYTPDRDSTAFAGAENLLNHFAQEVRKEKLLDDIKTEERNLSRLEGDLKKLERQNEKLHKDIEDYKSRITKAENDILENEKEQLTVNKDIKKQKEGLEELKKRLSDM